MLSPWQKIAISFLVIVTLFGVLVSDRWIIDAARGEVQSIEQWFGQAARDKVIERANGWYTTVVVDTGFQSEVWEGYSRTPEQRAKSPEFETGPFALGLDWFESRIRVFFTQVYQVFLRLSAIVLWAPYLSLIIVPAVLDGWVRRRIKQTNFAYTSPLWHRYSILLIRASVIGTLLLFLVPVKLPAAYIPTIGILIAMSLGFAMANTQKRI